MTTTEQQRLDEIADNAAHDCTNQIVRLHELLSGVQPSPIVIKSKVKSWMNQFITEALAPVVKERDELKDARQSAFKEAVEICERAKVVQKYYPQDRVHNGTCGELSKAILAHAAKEVV